MKTIGNGSHQVNLELLKLKVAASEQSMIGETENEMIVIKRSRL